MRRYNLGVMTSRPRKADQGHSIVRSETWTRTPVWGLDERRALTCQCGKRMTGNGMRALYTHGAHLRAMGVGA